VSNNTITRVKFTGCSSSSVPSTSAKDPAAISYNTPGVYNINLTVDDGLPTQATFCKQVVVLATPSIIGLQDADICPGNSTTLNPNVTGATSFNWSPSNGLSTANSLITVASPTVTSRYTLTASNEFGCSSKSSITVNVLTPQQCASVTPGFVAPDTVCLNTPVAITNTSVGASSYYWNFCVADVNTPPSGLNLGNVGGKLNTPVYIDYVFENGNYYGFLTNNDPAGNYNPGTLLRLDFGNSLLNTPSVTDLGSVGGILPHNAEGIQIVKNEGKWYLIIVGGDNIQATPNPAIIVKIELGSNIANNSPVGTNWGTIGNLAYPHDLYVFDDNGHWYGLTVNTDDNTITRFDFTTSLSNTPTAVNLGNIGNLSGPTGIFALKESGNWYAFVTNATNSTLTRLNFGSSLLTTPVGVNLGNISGKLQTCWDIQVMKYCGQNIGFVINAYGNDLVKLDFGSSILNTPSASSFGNIGNLSFPHCLSRIFRVGPDLYTFVPNVNNNTLTRMKFTGCTSSNIPNSSAQAPPPIIYNLPGTYNINLTVDDGLPTQTAFCKQVVVLAPPTHSPTQNLTVCEGGALKIGSGVKAAKYLWNTGAITDSILINIPGTYWVESDRLGCSVRDSFILTYSHLPLDFGFQQDMCSPKTVQFKGILQGVQSYTWDFGDGQTNSSSLSPTISYVDYGSYSIKLSVKYNGSCVDSLVKSILIDNVYDNSIIRNNDTVICLGDSVLLETIKSISNYCWKASTGAAPNSLNTYVKPLISSTYTLTSQVVGPNLVTNPNFSSGNMGFTSEYNYANPNITEGQYWVGTSSLAWNQNMSACHDHSSSNGNMLMVNGAPQAGVKVWSEHFTVKPNTNYNFSVWLSVLHANNPALLHFAINNVELGNDIKAGSFTCQWKPFFSTWNSGDSTSATISIVNNNTIVDGNDFALDDIFFGEVATRTDSMTVKVVGLCDSIKLTGSNKVCSRSDTLAYTIYKSPNCTQQYNIQVDNAYVDIVSQAPSTLKLVFKKDGNTTIKAVYPNNCKIVADSLNVAIKFSPSSVNLGSDLITCVDTSLLLNAGPGFVSYLWQDGSTDSTFIAKSAGIYTVVAQNLCGAQLRDTLSFMKSVVTPFTVSPLSATLCKGDSIQFKANGGTSYLWSPATNFSKPNTSSPKALIDASQDFQVYISDSICKRDTTFILPVVASPNANITVAKSNDVNCGNDSAILIANGGVSYVWSPDLYVARNNGNKLTVKPFQNTTYTVRGKDASGCVGKDSVTVYFFKEGHQKLFMPTAFTPNGDGLNDVFRPTFIGPSADYDFRIYNRWGQLVFRSKVPGVGWDGTTNGTPQKTDVYVFYLTAEGGCDGKFVQKGTFTLIR